VTIFLVNFYFLVFLYFYLICSTLITGPPLIAVSFALIGLSCITIVIAVVVIIISSSSNIKTENKEKEVVRLSSSFLWFRCNRFISDEEVFNRIRSTFTGLYTLDEVREM